jgi:DNA-binding NtrC family response regulator
MKELTILITGTNPDIMKVILRLLNSKDGWTGHTAFSVAEAIAKSRETAFDVVLIGAGINDEEALNLEKHFTVPVIRHYGGGSGLLYAEVYMALGM